MHVHGTQGVKHVRDIAQFGPVVLDVLARGEMAITFVPLVRYHRKRVHLGRIQRAIGNSNTQHVGMQLQVETVHQAQGFEFILGQRSIDAALDLGAELGVTLFQERSVKIGIMVHQMCSCAARSCLPWE